MRALAGGSRATIVGPRSTNVGCLPISRLMPARGAVDQTDRLESPAPVVLSFTHEETAPGDRHQPSADAGGTTRMGRTWRPGIGMPAVRDGPHHPASGHSFDQRRAEADEHAAALDR